MAEKYGTVPKKFTKEWWSWYWMYYKWHTIGVIFALFLVFLTFMESLTAEKYDLTLDVIECDWVSGAGLLIKKEAMPEGYLNTDFFFGCEDVDLAVEVKNKGYKVVTVTNSIIWHKVGMSRHKRSSFKTEYNHIMTNLKFIKKHKSNFYLSLPKYSYQIIKLYLSAIKNKL